MIASYIDSTNLKVDATKQDIINLCEEAMRYQMAAVCVLPYRVRIASSLLYNTNVKICTVIGFPLGADLTSTKVFAAKEALDQGADELDVVINLAAVKDGNFKLIKDEINSILDLKDSYKFVLKVIVETAVLSKSELITLTNLVSDLKCDYIKTSTGFSSRGVSINDIEIINKYKSDDLKVKASGGIKTVEFAWQLIRMGVHRLGTSNAKNLIEDIVNGEDY